MGTIAIFANRDSDQAGKIAAAVRAEGADGRLCDIQVGGGEGNRMSIGAGPPRWNGDDFSDVAAVHIRCTAPRTLPCPPPLLNAASHAEYRATYLREQEYNAATHAFFEDLSARGCLVVNRLGGGYVDHDSKGQFFLKLRDMGFPAPRTLTTTDPQRARAFLADVGEAVIKPAIGVGSTRLAVHLDGGDLAELSRCPTLFQERIKGVTLRVHVVAGTMVLALRILGGDFIDSRTDTRGFEFFDLDPEERRRIADATKALGLHYAAWDIMLDGDGRAYYLDCNPGPYVMWIGPEFRRFVFRQLARYLVGFAESRDTDEAAGRIEAWVEEPARQEAMPMIDEINDEPDADRDDVDEDATLAEDRLDEDATVEGAAPGTYFENGMVVAGLTDPGMVRDHNEDRFMIDTEVGLAAVADGVGGHDAGEIASRMALEAISDFLYEADDDLVAAETAGSTDPGDKPLNPHGGLVTAAVSKANKRIFMENQRIGAVRGMGTTVTGFVAGGGDGRVTVFNVGDSRVYRMRNGAFEQLTRDHTAHQDWLDAGEIGPEPKKNLILRALGVESEVGIDIATIDCANGDFFLVCSDGLHGMVEDAVVAQAISETDPVQLSAACKRIIDMANANGGKDNVTVVLAYMP